MDLREEILRQQRSEITEYLIYKKLAAKSPNEENRKILLNIADDEKRHYDIWKKVTGEEPEPDRFRIFWYVMLAAFFGLSFALKLMEGGEEEAQGFYERVEAQYPEAAEIRADENRHENELINILHDERLAYAGAIVLGLNDALVELTGTLAGLTLAFSNSLMIGVTGLIMGIAASLSMASSGYLSGQEGEEDGTDPIKSAIYTGAAYLVTVAVLVTPFFLTANVFAALGATLFFSILIIAGYTFYVSVAKEVDFKKRFLTMALISLGVAAISFAIGWALKHFLGIDV